MSRTRDRADRINKEISIVRLLSDYGYDVLAQGGDREQQYRCDLHGVDSKPSARVYPQSNSTFCFACGKSRDVIQFCIDREALSFRDACHALEGRYGLPHLPWTEEGDSDPAPRTVAEEIDSISRHIRTWEQEAKRVEKLLDNATLERELSMPESLAFWEAFDRIVYGVKREGWDEERGKVGMQTLRIKVMERLTGETHPPG